MTACLQQNWHDAVAADERDDAAAFGWESPRRVDLAPHQDVGPSEFRFGRWCLVPAARLLLHNGRPVELGSRAFDLLHLLSSQRGSVVEKRAIVDFVWPSTIVEESNLRFQMAALRKALGPDGALIKTIPGRGYILAEEYSAAPVQGHSSNHSPRHSPELTQLQVVGSS
jgi:DNA-binding winged helix-turn-helix (wHTH) protein